MYWKRSKSIAFCDPFGDKRSDCGSIVSAATNKSANGMFKKRCETCRFMIIENMPKHKKDVHGGVEVAPVKYTALKSNGKYFETLISITWLITIIKNQ